MMKSYSTHYHKNDKDELFTDLSTASVYKSINFHLQVLSVVNS